MSSASPTTCVADVLLIEKAVGDAYARIHPQHQQRRKLTATSKSPYQPAATMRPPSFLNDDASGSISFVLQVYAGAQGLFDFVLSSV